MLSTMGGVNVLNTGCAKIKKDCIGKRNILRIGKNSMIHGLGIYMRGNDISVEIGENVIIGKHCSIRCEGNNIKIVVGNYTTMTRDVHICAQEDNSFILIGEDCMFSNTITIRTSDSHPIYDYDGTRLNPPGNIKIGKHVWIAPGTTVLKGVEVGDSSIIASKSLVTKDVPESSLAGGVPAKILKSGIYWTRENLY